MHTNKGVGATLGLDRRHVDQATRDRLVTSYSRILFLACAGPTNICRGTELCYAVGIYLPRYLPMQCQVGTFSEARRRLLCECFVRMARYRPGIGLLGASARDHAPIPRNTSRLLSPPRIASGGLNSPSPTHLLSSPSPPFALSHPHTLALHSPASRLLGGPSNTETGRLSSPSCPLLFLAPPTRGAIFRRSRKALTRTRKLHTLMF